MIYTEHQVWHPARTHLHFPVSCHLGCSHGSVDGNLGELSWRRDTASPKYCFTLPPLWLCIIRSYLQWNYLFSPSYQGDQDLNSYDMQLFKLHNSSWGVSVHVNQSPVETCSAFFLFVTFVPRHRHAAQQHARFTTWPLSFCNVMVCITTTGQHLAPPSAVLALRGSGAIAF